MCVGVLLMLLASAIEVGRASAGVIPVGAGDNDGGSSGGSGSSGGGGDRGGQQRWRKREDQKKADLNTEADEILFIVRRTRDAHKVINNNSSNNNSNSNNGGGGGGGGKNGSEGGVGVRRAASAAKSKKRSRLRPVTKIGDKVQAWATKRGRNVAGLRALLGLSRNMRLEDALLVRERVTRISAENVTQALPEAGSVLEFIVHALDEVIGELPSDSAHGSATHSAAPQERLLQDSRKPSGGVDVDDRPPAPGTTPDKLDEAAAKPPHSKGRAVWSRDPMGDIPLVTENGERNLWDDILEEQLSKCPTVAYLDQNRPTFTAEGGTTIDTPGKQLRDIGNRNAIHRGTLESARSDYQVEAASSAPKEPGNSTATSPSRDVADLHPVFLQDGRHDANSLDIDTGSGAQEAEPLARLPLPQSDVHEEVAGGSGGPLVDAPSASLEATVADSAHLSSGSADPSTPAIATKSVVAEIGVETRATRVHRHDKESVHGEHDGRERSSSRQFRPLQVHPTPAAYTAGAQSTVTYCVGTGGGGEGRRGAFKDGAERRPNSGVEEEKGGGGGRGGGVRKDSGVEEEKGGGRRGGGSARRDSGVEEEKGEGRGEGIDCTLQQPLSPPSTRMGYFQGAHPIFPSLGDVNGTSNDSSNSTVVEVKGPRVLPSQPSLESREKTTETVVGRPASTVAYCRERGHLEDQASRRYGIPTVGAFSDVAAMDWKTAGVSSSRGGGGLGLGDRGRGDGLTGGGTARRSFSEGHMRCGKSWGATVSESNLRAEWFVEQDENNMDDPLALQCWDAEQRAQEEEWERRAPEREEMRRWKLRERRRHGGISPRPSLGEAWDTRANIPTPHSSSRSCQMSEEQSAMTERWPGALLASSKALISEVPRLEEYHRGAMEVVFERSVRRGLLGRSR